MYVFSYPAVVSPEVKSFHHLMFLCPLQSLTQLTCSYEAENHYLVCDLGNPMKSGASVRASNTHMLPLDFFVPVQFSQVKLFLHAAIRTQTTGSVYDYVLWGNVSVWTLTSKNFLSAYRYHQWTCLRAAKAIFRSRSRSNFMWFIIHSHVPCVNYVHFLWVISSCGPAFASLCPDWRTLTEP